MYDHEEGRIRAICATPQSNPLVYEYMLKDHLGNVRMVLTEEEKQQQYPAATLEPASTGQESLYYGNLSSTQHDKPSWFSAPVFPTNAKVARVKNASGIQKIGPNIMLKVMAGDRYNIRVASGWHSGTASNSQTNVLNDLFNLLTGNLAGMSDGKATQGALQNSSSGIQAAVQAFLTTQTTSSNKPKAYTPPVPLFSAVAKAW